MEDRYKCESITAASTAQQNMRTQRREGVQRHFLEEAKSQARFERSITPTCRFGKQGGSRCEIGP